MVQYFLASGRTFGGAYAVLAYVAQEAIRYYHWLSAPEVLSWARPIVLTKLT